MTSPDFPETDPNLGSAGSDSAAAPTDDLESLRTERDKYLEMAKRARADFENYQKRVARDWETDRKYAAQPMIADLIPALDNLDRALESAKGKPDATGVVAGVELVRKQFETILAKHGVSPIRPGFETFDPNQHEAMMQQPTAEHPPMTVLQTVQPGYKFHDRVVRPAQVIVAAAPK